MSINEYINNNYYYKTKLHYIILYCKCLIENDNFLNYCISKNNSKKNGKTIIYMKIFNYNNIEDNNIYLYLVFTHNNVLIKGNIYDNNNFYYINKYYVSSFTYNNQNYNNVIFCKINNTDYF